MKFSASLYSYYSAIRKNKITPMEIVKLSKELGFDCIEAVDFVNLGDDPDALTEKAKALRDEADKHGLPFSSLAIGADFLNGCGGDTKKEIERVKKYIDAAVILGAPRMRHDITAGVKEHPRSYEALLPALAECVREIADYAAEKGVMTMSENHGFFSQDANRVERLYNAVNHPNFALLCDIGNFLCADENPALSVAKVARYTKYVHAKDFIVKDFNSPNPGEGSFQTRAGNYLRGTIVGQGNVPVKQCLHILKNAGYDDTIAIEFEGMEDPVDALRIGLANLKRYWAELNNEG